MKRILEWTEFEDAEEKDNNFKEDFSLEKFKRNRTYLQDWESMRNFPNEEMIDMVVKYLNWKLPILYSKQNNPDDPFTAKIVKERLIREGSVHLLKSKIDGEKCYMFYFDSDRYRFEGSVFLTEDNRILFTDD